MRVANVVLSLCLASTAAVSLAGVPCGAPGDAAQIAAARAQIDGSCPCASASSRGAYLRCVAGVLAQRTATGMLRNECAGSVHRCAASSVCGRPGTVTCCRPTHAGLRCRIRPGAAACQAIGGTPHACPSCCEACSTGCTTSTTATTTTLPVTCAGDGFTCGGTCPPGERCATDSRLVPLRSCVCLPDTGPACGETAYPTCGGLCAAGNVCQAVSENGDLRADLCLCVASGASCDAAAGMCLGPGPCPAGDVCIVSSEFPNSICSCGAPPTTTTVTTTTQPPDGSCAHSTYPACGGACALGQTCQSVRLQGQVNVTFCTCVANGSSCFPQPGSQTCTAGLCPPGSACTGTVTAGQLACDCSAP